MTSQLLWNLISYWNSKHRIFKTGLSITLYVTNSQFLLLSFYSSNACYLSWVKARMCACSFFPKHFFSRSDCLSKVTASCLDDSLTLQEREVSASLGLNSEDYECWEIYSSHISSDLTHLKAPAIQARHPPHSPTAQLLAPCLLWVLGPHLVGSKELAASFKEVQCSLIAQKLRLCRAVSVLVLLTELSLIT